MNRQKSFDNEKSTLYLVATPIGNLEEMTERAVEVLKNVDVIACEDTRTSGILLNKFNINNKLIAHHLHNEKESTKGIIELLNQGKNIALISDAGYPLFSDPGQFLAYNVIKEGFNLVPISGSNACINALIASGITTQPYTFFGFLESSETKRKNQLMELKEHPFTIVFYESPHRINKMLKNVLEIFGDREVSIARELTKKHEEFIRGKVSELIDLEYKGELVVVISGYKKEIKDFNDNDIKEMVDMEIAKGLSTKDAIKKISKEINKNKNDIYKIYHK